MVYADTVDRSILRNYCANPFVPLKWWLGLSGVIVGAIGDFVALGFASQSLVSALGGGTTLICNVVVAHLWNKVVTLLLK